jgi:hypothetical protein
MTAVAPFHPLPRLPPVHLAVRLRRVESEVPIHPDLVWDYREPPADLSWRLQRIADAFPAYGRDRRTVALLFAHRAELRVPPEQRLLIELYEEAWRRRGEGAR